MNTEIMCYGVRYNSAKDFAKILGMTEKLLTRRMKKLNLTYEGVYDLLECNEIIDGITFTKLDDIVKYTKKPLSFLMRAKESRLNLSLEICCKLDDLKINRNLFSLHYQEGMDYKEVIKDILEIEEKVEDYKSCTGIAIISNKLDILSSAIKDAIKENGLLTKEVIFDLIERKKNSNIECYGKKYINMKEFAEYLDTSEEDIEKFKNLSLEKIHDLYRCKESASSFKTTYINRLASYYNSNGEDWRTRMLKGETLFDLVEKGLK